MNTYKRLISYFGTQEGIAEAFNIKQPSVSQWNGVIPVKHAKKVERITKRQISAIDVVNDYDQHQNESSGKEPPA